MPEYVYTAKNEKGQVSKGKILAKNDVELANTLAQSGYYLTSFKSLRESSTAHVAAKTAMPKLKPKEVLRFTFQCATLLSAGLSLLDGLSEFASESENKNMQIVMNDIRSRIEKGSTFKEALSAHSKSFSKFYVSIIGAGEASGKLVNVMNDLVAFLEWHMEFKSKVAQAATYPAILSIVGMGAVILLVTKVVPTFEPLFKEAGATLPGPTQLVLGLSHFVRDFWYLILGGVGLIVFGYKVYDNTPDGHLLLDRIKLRIPLVGVLLHKLALTHFTRTAVICFRGGIPILQTLNIARETCDNVWIMRSLAKAEDLVNMGNKLATSLQMAGEFPSFVLRMISVGEQSGSLSETLLKVSDYYDKEVDATIKKLMTLMEPIIIVVMGIIIGMIALAIFMPLFRISELIGK